MRTVLCVLCCLGLPTGMMSPSVAGAQTQSATSADWAAAAAVLRELDAAYDARDAARFSACFVDEASFEFPVEGQRMRGREDIRRAFAERFQTLEPAIRHVTTVRAVDEIGSELVAVDFDVDIVRADTTAVNAPTRLFHYSGVGVGMRRNSQWKIRLARVYRMTK